MISARSVDWGRNGLLSVILACVVWQFAVFFWHLMSVNAVDASYAQPEIQHAFTTKSSAPSAPLQVSQFNALHLFGRAAADEVSTSVSKQYAHEGVPETSLNLILRGTRKGSGGLMSSAIIEADQKIQQRYVIGDAIVGLEGVTIDDIYPKYVVLRRRGHYEILSLFSQEASAQSPVRDQEKPQKLASKRIDKTQDGALGQSVKAYVDALQKNPMALFGLVSFKPYSENGTVKGYRVYPGKDRSLFQRLGLKRGDVVTAVDGLALNDPANLDAIKNTFTTASVVNISLLRKGEPHQYAFNLQ